MPIGMYDAIAGGQQRRRPQAQAMFSAGGGYGMPNWADHAARFSPESRDELGLALRKKMHAEMGIPYYEQPKNQDKYGFPLQAQPTPQQQQYGPQPPSGYKPPGAPMAGFIGAMKGSRYGTAAQVGGDEAYNAFLAQPQGYQGQRAAFNQQYGDHLQSQAGNPGQGLLSNESAAQMGNYRNMPNVTVGGAYGRGGSGDNTDLLNSLLGLNGQGGSQPGGVTDPGTLGALRQRLKAPWMNGGRGQQQQAGLPAMQGLDGNPQALAMSRQARARASGGRLIAGGVGEANRGNYSFSDAADTSPDAINIQRLLAQNPAAFHGFSDETKQKLLQGGQNPIAGIQQAYRERQAGPQGVQMPTDPNAVLTPQQRVMQNSMARNQQREGRIEQRQQGPDLMEQLFRQDPRAAAAMMNQRQQNELAARGLGLAEQRNKNDFELGQGRNKVLGDQAAVEQSRWDMEYNNKQAAVREAVAAQLQAANPTWTREQSLAKATEQYPNAAGRGGQNAMPGLQGPLPGQKQPGQPLPGIGSGSPIPDAAAIAKFRDDPETLVSAWLDAGWSEQQVNKELARIYKDDKFKNTRTARNPRGGGGFTTGKEEGVDPETGATYPTNLLAPLFDAFTGANQSEYDWTADPTPEAPKRQSGKLRKAGRANWLDRWFGAPVTPPQEVYKGFPGMGY
mgnify:CR=1 FL=1